MMAQNMGATNQHIHCTISNCHYWDQGNTCVANEIIVVNDATGAAKPDTYDHQMAKQAPKETADSCMETCCKTFVPDDSKKIGVDGTTRLK